MNTAGLSLDQAPPIGVPFRFFVTAPLFLVVAALLLMIRGPEIFASRWMPVTLAVTHLITLGFLAQIMLGAMVQLLPVLAGSPVPWVRESGALVHVSLVIGTVLLAGGFIGGQGLALVFGGVFLGLGFWVFMIVAGMALWRAKGARHTIRAMGLALAALAITGLIGGVLVLALAGHLHLADFERWVDLHLVWGLAGWVGLLLMGVALELVPMFYMTPRYPALVCIGLAPGGFAALLVWSLLAATGIAWSGLGLMVVALLFLVFVGVTLQVTLKRKRPVMDVTLLYLWSGNLALALAVLGWRFDAPEVLFGVLALGGAGLAFPMGMLYKIVPFLCWFHLQGIQVQSGSFERQLPLMRGFISENRARWQFALYAGALLLLVLGVWQPSPWIRIGGGLLLLAAILFLSNLLHAIRVFRREAAALRAVAEGPGMAPQPPA